ncbi:PIR Superfamily Protein [Plasmodium ovale curtisi]|uniref:PIR Superfamily Protein n=1 Tax=Plasmodium ovale curtisi TaxID=864141 RepID=A0A1A8XD94_PLAOA|nr:PIR Superfamily Protein [Plasmodium ovale curtisi]
MCSQESNIYSFFKDFKKYKFYEKKVEDDFIEDKHGTTCHSFLPNIQISSTENAKSICEKFKYLKSLVSKKGHAKPDSLDHNDFSFLNYWLYNKITNSTVDNNITVNLFLEKLNDYDSQLFRSDEIEGKLCDIGEVDFKNVNLLIYLHINSGVIYEKINSLKGVKIACLDHYKELIDTYKKGILKCPLDENNFCNALKKYKEEYEKISGPKSVSEKCIDQKSLKLPIYEDVLLEYITLSQKGDEKNIVIGTILVPTFAALFILVFLYAFTPIGQWIRAKIGKNKITHSNLYGKNNQLLLDTSDNEYINSTHNPYSISYDSAVNS